MASLLWRPSWLSRGANVIPIESDGGEYLMSIKSSVVFLRYLRCLKAPSLWVLMVFSLLLWSPYATGQKAAVPKLTLAQVEQLVSNKVPDSTLSAQIQKRGLAFKPSAADLDALRAKGAGPLTIAAVEALLLNTALGSGPTRYPRRPTLAARSFPFSSRIGTGRATGGCFLARPILEPPLVLGEEQWGRFVTL